MNTNSTARIVCAEAGFHSRGLLDRADAGLRAESRSGQCCNDHFAACVFGHRTEKVYRGEWIFVAPRSSQAGSNGVPRWT